MAEAVTFWLDNKVSSGVKVAETGDQTLVCYRDKFYVVEGGAARMKGSRPLHYTRSSLPAAWKKAMAGNQPPAAAIPPGENATLPRTAATGKERPSMEKPAPTGEDQPETVSGAELLRQTSPPPAAPARSKARPAAPKSAAKPEAQTLVVAACPYCNHNNELPLEKGKNGKPFFTACTRCQRDFAVRFVPVTAYQAQVAAFT